MMAAEMNVQTTSAFAMVEEDLQDEYLRPMEDGERVLDGMASWVRIIMSRAEDEDELAANAEPDPGFKYLYIAKSFGSAAEEGFAAAGDIGGITMLYRQARHMLLSGEVSGLQV
jgi:hypothetical protein